MSLQNEFRVSELISSGSAVITSQNSSGNHTFYVKPTNEDFDGETSGYVEKPKYNETELKKAVNVDVVELIPQTPKEQPKVVPQKTYDNLQGLYSGSLIQIKDLSKQLNDANSKIQTLTTENENLITQIDVEKLLRASAENELEITNTKYVALVQDFQNALSKGIREGIERVSLEAQLRGLQAEKETFNQLQTQLQSQLDSANVRMVDLQSQVTNAQQLLASAQIQASQSQAAAAAAQAAKTQAELSTKKNSKIICDLLYRQGFIPEHIWKADEEFGSMMLRTNKPVAIGYLIWAQGVVDFLKKKPEFSKYVYIGVKPWSEHMAYMMGVLPTDNKVGKFIHYLGCKFSVLTYNLYKFKRKNKINQLSVLWQ
jgi:hypothetical protein